MGGEAGPALVGLEFLGNWNQQSPAICSIAFTRRCRRMRPGRRACRTPRTSSRVLQLNSSRLARKTCRRTWARWARSRSKASRPRNSLESPPGVSALLCGRSALPAVVSRQTSSVWDGVTPMPGQTRKRLARNIRVVRRRLHQWRTGPVAVRKGFRLPLRRAHHGGSGPPAERCR